MYSSFIAGLTGGAMVGLIFKFVLTKSEKQDAPVQEQAKPEHLLVIYHDILILYTLFYTFHLKGHPYKCFIHVFQLSKEGPIYKLALVVNHELKMTAGKIVAQVHSSLEILWTFECHREHK